MVSFIWILLIALKAFGVAFLASISWWLIILWPLIPIAVIVALALCGVTVGVGMLGLGSLVSRKRIR